MDSPHSQPYQGIDQQLVHTLFVSIKSWSSCAPLICNQGFPAPLGRSFVSTNPVTASDICFSSSQFRKEHARYEKAVSKTSLVVAVYAWSCEAFQEGE
ncbi:unnamed protein product [Schistosoma curassoni]|uniref:Uncharacterized protein n=1 Tax=Schistosoma curassoni TaxID=6186 RepID=A0A183K079_9TREM|nr:unnamed protein product [Schistosoma curassoni]